MAPATPPMIDPTGPAADPIPAPTSAPESPPIRSREGPLPTSLSGCLVPRPLRLLPTSDMVLRFLLSGNIFAVRVNGSPTGPLSHNSSSANPALVRPRLDWQIP